MNWQGKSATATIVDQVSFEAFLPVHPFLTTLTVWLWLSLRWSRPHGFAVHSLCGFHRSRILLRRVLGLCRSGASSSPSTAAATQNYQTTTSPTNHDKTAAAAPNDHAQDVIHVVSPAVINFALDSVVVVVVLFSPVVQ